MDSQRKHKGGVGRMPLPSGTNTKVSPTPSSNRLLSTFSGVIVLRAIDKSEVTSNLSRLAIVASDSNNGEKSRGIYGNDKCRSSNHESRPGDGGWSRT
jgi:hypothetical protein